MLVTSIRIYPADDESSQVKATADVILNDSLSLSGIKIIQGRYGLFLAFPHSTARTGHRLFDAVSMKFRRELQQSVLKAYGDCLARPLPLFG